MLKTQRIRIVIINLLFFITPVYAETINKTCLLSILQSLNKRTSNIPIQTTNIKTLQKNDEKLIRDFFKPNNISFSMVQDEKLRAHIIEQNLANKNFRFKNYFETGTSNAASAIDPRTTIETYRLGLSPNDYKKIPYKERPKYGYMQFKKPLKDGQKSDYHLPQYGDDIWIFNTKKVQDNVTFTVGDSFSYSGTNPHLMTEKEFDYSNRRFITDNNVKTQSKFTDPYKTFLPYTKRNREFLVEYFAKQVNESGYRQKSLFKRTNSAKPNYIWNDPYSSDKDPLSMYNYFEVQYFDTNLNLDKVEQFIFTKNPPNEDLLKILKSKKIKVLDWRIKRRGPITYSIDRTATSKINFQREKEFYALLDNVEKYFFIKKPSEEQMIVFRKVYRHGLPKNKAINGYNFTPNQLKEKKAMLIKAGFSKSKIPYLMDFFIR